MNRLSGLVVGVVVLLLSAPALAQDDTPAAAPEHPWSLGAGLGGGLSLSSLLSLFGSGTVTASAPAAVLSVERRMTPKTSLLMALTATATSNTTAPENQTGGFTSSSTTSVQAFGLALGVRQVLLGDLQTVAVSGDASLGYGFGRTERSSSASNGTTTTTSSTVANQGALTLHAGIAGEKLLTEQLSVRVGLGLFDASYSAGRNVGTGFGGGAQSVSGFDLGIRLTPSLELRLYF